MEAVARDDISFWNYIISLWKVIITSETNVYELAAYPWIFMITNVIKNFSADSTLNLCRRLEKSGIFNLQKDFLLSEALFATCSNLIRT